MPALLSPLLSLQAAAERAYAAERQVKQLLHERDNAWVSDNNNSTTASGPCKMPPYMHAYSLHKCLYAVWHNGRHEQALLCSRLGGPDPTACFPCNLMFLHGHSSLCDLLCFQRVCTQDALSSTADNCCVCVIFARVHARHRLRSWTAKSSSWMGLTASRWSQSSTVRTLPVKATALATAPPRMTHHCSRPTSQTLLVVTVRM
jgi:hypothetical protein